jgi:hypothetical protein
MSRKYRELGHVLITQVQPRGLIQEYSSGSKYDPSNLKEVARLFITPEGIEADTPQGERILDVHHIAHPDTRYSGENDISIGFTAHYDAMRAKFGAHLKNGTAGENIIIAHDKEVWVEDMGDQIAIENSETGEKALFDVNKFAAPCEEFSHFAANSQDERLHADKLKETLQFLRNGRRGFYLSISAGQDMVTVQPGDKVYAVGKT